MMEESEGTRSGYVAIIGRPNVGKSTLLNQILGQKISITSRKPQTTRHQLLGIKTTDNAQVLYVDTPGIHRHDGRALNRYMNKSALSVIQDVDVVVLILDRKLQSEVDEGVLAAMKKGGFHLIVCLNKVDLVKNKPTLLPELERLQKMFPEADLLPISAEKGHNVPTLEALIAKHLPPGPFFYAEDQVTDRSERFLVSEAIREKVMRLLGDELPYAVTIQIERFKDAGKILHIDALALVERDGQKAILIGKGGEQLKRISSEARTDIEALLQKKVMLKVWVKVKSGWSDDERALKSLGYDDV